MARDQDPRTLLDHPDLWRAGELKRPPEAVASEFPALDAHLAGGGFPRAGLSELLLDTAGIGELRLLLPALARLGRQQRWIAWINPPFIPYAPALEAAGVDIAKILLVHPKTHDDALWALERASRSGTCSAALAWLDERRLGVRETRRLKLAAANGRTSTWLFRPTRAATQSSSAELRLQVAPGAPGDVRVDILKRRGGWPVMGLTIPIGGTTASDALHEQLALWRCWRRSACSRDPAHGQQPFLPRELPRETGAADAPRPVTH